MTNVGPDHTGGAISPVGAAALGGPSLQKSHRRKRVAEGGDPYIPI